MVGFILFSAIMMVYLPAYQQALYQLQHLSFETRRYQLFDDLVTLYYLGPDDTSGLNQRIQAYQIMEGDQVDDFACDLTACRLNFRDGSKLEVAVVGLLEGRGPQSLPPQNPRLAFSYGKPY